MKLVEPNGKYLKEYKEAYELMLEKVKQGQVKKHDITFSNIDKIDIIQKFIDDKDINKLPKGYVPSYNYFLVDEDRFVGEIHIRTELTPNLLVFGGNIGYGISPKYWKQGYGTKILELGLEKAKDLIKEDKVLITCDDDNIGSSKVIEKNGGILENKIKNIIDGEEIITRRYWIRIR